MTEPEPLALLMQTLRPLLEGLTDAAVVVDRDLRPVGWNEAYARSLGGKLRSAKARLTAEGARCCDLYRLEVCATACLAKRALGQRQPVRMDELQGQATLEPTAEQDMLIVSATPLYGADNEPLAVLEVYRNVTAEGRVQRRYQDMLHREQRRSEELAEQVRQRTADLQQSLDHLKAAKDTLVQSEKLKSLGILVAGIAHELNNPINFVGGNIEFLQEHVGKLRALIDSYEKLELSAEQQERIQARRGELDYDYVVEDLGKLMQSIAVGAQRAATIVQGLRTFVHKGGDKMVPLDMAECVEQTVSLWAHQLRGRVVLERQYADGLPMVEGNPGQLGQVFMNILSNAVHAVGESGKIVIRVAAEDAGVKVEFADSGHGMSPEVLGRVFDPFFTTKDPGQGTGLGLSICYSIMEAHHGTIRVASVVNEGTKFSIWIPPAPGGDSGHGDP